MSQAAEIARRPDGPLLYGLSRHKAGLTVVLGIGNPLCGDDGLGCEVARLLNLPCDAADQTGARTLGDEQDQQRDAATRLRVLVCEEMPENFTADVKQLHPECIILIDAVDFCGKPGEMICATTAELQSDRFNTHKPALGLLMRYLEAETGAAALLIGVQPKSRTLHAGLSREVQESIGHLVALLTDMGLPSEKRNA